MTPKDIFENQIAERAKSPKAKEIDAVFFFDITGDQGGPWTVDLKQGEVRNEAAKDADCTITVSDENFVKLVQGEVPAPQLFMMGQLQVAGNMGLAMKLGEIVG